MNVVINGREIDIHDDDAMREELTKQCLDLVALVPEEERGAQLLELFIDVRMFVVKFGAVLLRASAANAPGIGINTAGELYNYARGIVGEGDMVVEQPDPKIVLPN